MRRKITLSAVASTRDSVSDPGAIAASAPEAPLRFRLSPSAPEAGAPPHFDSAAVTSSSVFRDFSVKVEAARMEIHKATLKQLILIAYPISVCQIIWRGWMEYDASYFANNHPSAGPFYEITATFPAGTTVEQRQLMLRRLLAQQLNLVVHTAIAALPVYAVYAKLPG